MIAAAPDLQTVPLSVRKRPRRARAVAGILALVAVVVGSEIAARQVMSTQLEAEMRAILPADGVTVGLGPRPALLDLVTGYTPTVQIDADQATVSAIPGIDLTIVLHGVHLPTSAGDPGTVSRTTASALLTVSALNDVLGGKTTGIAPALTVDPEPASGVLRVRIGDVGSLTVRPRIDGTTIAFDVKQATLLGRTARSAALTRISALVAQPVALDGLPLDLRATAVTVEPDGLALTLVGGTAELPGTTAKATSATGPTRHS